MTGSSLTLGSLFQDNSVRKKCPHSTWLCKPVGIAFDRDKKLLESQVFIFRGQPETSSLTYSLTLGSSAGPATQRVQGSFIKELDQLTSEWGLEGQWSGQLSPGMKALADANALFLSPLPTQWAEADGHEIWAIH